MARFRPFGRRRTGPADRGPDPWLDDPVGESPAVPSVRRRRFDDRGYGPDGYGGGEYGPDGGTDEPRDDDGRRSGGYVSGRRGTIGPGFGDPDAEEGFATSRAAAPALWAPRPSAPDPLVPDDAPVTDPFGFPPVPPIGETPIPSTTRDRSPAWAAWVPRRRSDGPTPAAEVPLAIRSPRDEEGPDDVAVAVRAGAAGGVGASVADRRDDPPDPTADRGGHPARVDRDLAAGPTDQLGHAEPGHVPEPDRPRAGPGTHQVDGRDRSDGNGAGDGSRDDDRAVAAHRDGPARAVAAERGADGTAAPVADHSWTGTDPADVPDTAERQAVRVVEPSPAVAAAAFPEPRREPAGSAAPAAPVAVAHVAAAPDPAEAAALAGAFAADYLSWDEDDPARRGRALADHLPGSPADHALLGWSGAGRQRAEIVLPGAVRPDGDERVLVDVRVRVTPYRRVSRSEATPEPEPRDTLGTPAAAPPVTARGWRGLAARWVRLGVTVVRDGDRLVVDAGEEAFDAPVRESPRPPSSRTDRTAEDPTLDGDDDAPHGSGR